MIRRILAAVIRATPPTFCVACAARSHVEPADTGRIAALEAQLAGMRARAEAAEARAAELLPGAILTAVRAGNFTKGTP